jgi:hypothetical protein
LLPHPSSVIKMLSAATLATITPICLDFIIQNSFLKRRYPNFVYFCTPIQNKGLRRAYLVTINQTLELAGKKH